ncbi:MAG: hypothetical protein QOE86_3891 [Solirubrobacteraceae bacterium]|nr:hypothetical protein [Solirubrobacteraceae bacterium]
MHVAANCPPTPTAWPSPVVADSLLGSSVACWAATAEAAGSYWGGALERRATPLDVAEDALRWWEVMTDRRPPRWSSPNVVVRDWGHARLRDLSQGSTDDVVGTLLLPPQAGHDSCIVDFSDGQSQVQVIRAAGLTRVWSLDWVGATAATRDASIDDYLRSVRESVEVIGGPVNLVGDCQGGWLAAIYAALHPEDVHTLTIAGAPIDFHADRALIHGYVETCDPAGDMAFYRRVVAAAGGVLPGQSMLGGFIAMKPESEVERQLQLLGALDDPVHLDRYREFEDWFKHTQAIPGAFYLWIVEHLFRDNALIAGELDIHGRRVDLAAIDCPLYLLAGETDHITPPGQVFAMAGAVSTAPEEIVQRTTSGGHLGLFMGREALREHWPPLMADVAARSREASRQLAERRARAGTAPAPGVPPLPAP